MYFYKVKFLLPPLATITSYCTFPEYWKANFISQIAVVGENDIQKFSDKS